MEGKPMSIATRTFGLALTALALMAGEAQAQAGTITDPFVQVIDDARANRDSFTIRGRIDATGSAPVSDGVTGGATVSAFQVSSTGSALPGYEEIASLSFAGSDCRAANGGLSLFCKDATTGSTLRVRGTSAQPDSCRMVANVRGQEFDPGKPFGTPLAGEIEVGSAGGAFLGVTATCRVSHNGDRYTCNGEGVAPTPTPTPCVHAPYTDNGDGTVSDSCGLTWEQKTGTPDGSANPSDPHDVNNNYTWTAVYADPWPFDGTVKTEFLDQLNCQGAYTSSCTPWLGGGWRLPTIIELGGRQSSGFATGGIVDLTVAGCGAPDYSAPCIHAIFGPTASSSYWSSDVSQNNPYNAWIAAFFSGYVDGLNKSYSYYARAVRSAS